MNSVKKIPVAVDDLLQFKSLSCPVLSPGGEKVAFMVHQSNKAQMGYISDLWIYDINSGETTKVIGANTKPTYCWTEDGSLLYAVPGEQTEFSCLKADSRTEKAFTVPAAVKSIQPVGDSVWLVEATSYLTPEAAGLKREKVCIALEELPCQYNAQGYTAGSRNSLYLFDQTTETFTQITPTHFETMGFSFCPEERKIVCHGHDYTNVRGHRGCVYLYDLASNEGRVVIGPQVYRIYYVTMVQGKVLFVGTIGKHDSNENPTFYMADPNSGCVCELCYPDLYVGGLGIGTDCRYGGGVTSMRCGSSIYFTSPKFESCHLFEVNTAGELRQVSRREGSVDSFDIKAGRAVFVGLRDMGLQELYALDLTTGEEKQLTSFNQVYKDTHSIQKPIPCFFNNHDGVTITGWTILPTDFDPGKKYPAILDIHGGPKACYGIVFYHEMQLWANQGYFVFFCNPRGSDGHGDAYSTISGLNGTLDYDDLMEFTDHVLLNYPQIDTSRVGVTGGSYGGFLTNWIVGHTDRFAAAATQRSIGDWIAHYSACDSGYWVTSEQFPPSPLHNAADAWDHSPSKYAMNIKTPMLFIHSDDDRRCPLCEMMAIYTGAGLAGNPIRMCLFHGENHELGRTGKPICRMKRISEITCWMDKYLKGGEQ